MNLRRDRFRPNGQGDAAGNADDGPAAAEANANDDAEGDAVEVNDDAVMVNADGVEMVKADDDGDAEGEDMAAHKNRSHLRDFENDQEDEERPHSNQKEFLN